MGDLQYCRAAGLELGIRQAEGTHPVQYGLGGAIGR